MTPERLAEIREREAQCLCLHAGELSALLEKGDGDEV